MENSFHFKHIKAKKMAKTKTTSNASSVKKEIINSIADALKAIGKTSKEIETRLSPVGEVSILPTDRLFKITGYLPVINKKDPQFNSVRVILDDDSTCAVSRLMSFKPVYDSDGNLQFRARRNSTTGKGGTFTEPVNPQIAWSKLDNLIGKELTAAVESYNDKFVDFSADGVTRETWESAPEKERNVYKIDIL